MSNYLSTKELYKIIEDLKIELIELKKENLYLLQNLADMAEFTQESLGIEETLKEIEDNQINEIREDFSNYNNENMSDVSFLQYLINKGE
ncbi:MAG: hypothetical protein WA916_07370 [Arcobacter sp.]|uniref:hypothetical protein n=1 Tax=Arcobacter sp. TaxID=1872629 RepID=UPI003C769D28